MKNIRYILAALILSTSYISYTGWIHIWNNTSQALGFKYILSDQTARKAIRQNPVVSPYIPKGYIPKGKGYTFHNIEDNPKELRFLILKGIDWYIKGTVDTNTGHFTNRYIEIQDAPDDTLKARWYFLGNKGGWHPLK
ncbi:hypothetical protein KAH94_04575 [bacterium]|nr:hypothetical protein [bacterium]